MDKQGTPLWCEYLPPWVLRKEFHTILAAYGVQYLCSERFRQGLGPAEDSSDPSGGEGWREVAIVFCRLAFLCRHPLVIMYIFPVV